MDEITKLSFKKIAYFYELHEDELLSEAWLIRHENPEITNDQLCRKVRNRCIQMVKINGITQSTKVCADFDDADNFESHHIGSPSTLDVLVDIEAQRIRESRIETLSSIDRARLDAASTCRNGKEFSTRLNRSIGKRQANSIIKNWCQEDRQAPPAQASLFN